MGDTWITDMRHFLDQTGSFPANMPGPALTLALFLGDIVAWVTTQGPGPYQDRADEDAGEGGVEKYPNFIGVAAARCSES